MKQLYLAAALSLAALGVHAQTSADRARWSAEAARVTIVRDDWGIAHVHGPSDADAVFGMIYAQCEDDFNRVENNYLVALGRLAESDGPDGGEIKLWQDLRQRLFIDPDDLRKQYAASPPWLQSLMNAWADGVNFYLAEHPAVKPHVLTHWEPWMALSFTEGSIGGDIERVNLQQLRAFYDHSTAAQLSSPALLPTRVEPSTTLLREHSVSSAPPVTLRATLESPQELVRTEDSDGGSNGFAIAPSNTVSHHALLLINPHTSFFFRSELQMTSDEGLNAYGAVTWGQLFVYQGFNERAGWMHTSSGVDAVDEFADTVVSDKPDTPAYKFGSTTRRFLKKEITLSYRTPAGLKQRTFTAFFDHRGPIVREENGAWISTELMNRPIAALEQSFLRTKAHTYAEYRKTMQLQANSSNNTIFADADGDIAYWHGNFIPTRDPHFDYTHPVDGANPTTDWQRLMSVDELPHLLNPASGWLENVNNWPWSGAGASSLKRADFPAYVEQGTESARGLHAIRVLQGRTDFTLDNLLSTAAFDPYQPWFARTVPLLVQAYDALPADAPRKAALRDEITLLRTWDFRWGFDSLPTTLAVYWGEAVLTPIAADARRAHQPSEEYVADHVSPSTLLDALAAASARLQSDFGTWRKPWGEVNRFQRLDDDIVTHFDDNAPSIAIPFTSSVWGSLASFATRPNSGTRKRYGVSGNSFVAVVEFGPRVRARAVTAGGESGHPASPHFTDEATRYATGNFRDVYFYPDQLKGHTERVYHPGH